LNDLNSFLYDPSHSGVWAYALRWAIAAFVIAAIFGLFFWRRSDFCIEVKFGKVAFHGKFPMAFRPACSEFLLRDLVIHGPARIYAVRQKDRWRLWFRGGIGAGEQQQIRNFIVTRLGAR
jgi:hypothetical protein